MPEVIFDEEFRYQILNQANLQLWFWPDGWLKLKLFTAGNGISNKNLTRSGLEGLSALWTSSGPWTINRNNGEDGLFEISNNNFVSASNNGLAAEFLLYNNFSQTDAACIAGTIGNSASGADMIMNDPNIVAGTQYKVMNWRIRFFQSFSY